MNYIKKAILLGILSFFINSSLNAYSYASAGKEKTIDAKKAITEAINKKDFKKVKFVFYKYKENYKYLNDDFNNEFYNSLENAIISKDIKEIVRWLNISLALEIQRRLDGALKNINTFNISKVMLAKANKYYKLLSSGLHFKNNQVLKKALQDCTIAIGNPGLFGVGAKKHNKEKYIKNQKIILKVLQSL